MKAKILIIKLGYSETLDQEIGRVPSLGDVVRTTPILWALKEKYKNSHITWLVSEESEPFLSGINLIDKVLVWDDFVPFQLMREKFDILINLEKISGVCALADMIDAWVKYGFRFDAVEGVYHAYEKGMSFIDYLREKQTNGKSKQAWQKVLIEMLGSEWKEQDYIIGYKPKGNEIHDIGFNYVIGQKWPTKEMPVEKWKGLEKKLLELGYSVSWQRGLNSLYEYMDWINSCRIIITHDTLGMHLGLAFKKKLVILFGPTDPRETYTYDRAKIVVSPQKCELIPCFQPKCKSGMHCMNQTNLDEVVTAVRSF
jgi:heptosyltransferase-2